HNAGLDAPWGLGWALRDSLVWNFFGDLASARTFGHVGATGTVAWADRDRQRLMPLRCSRMRLLALLGLGRLRRRRSGLFVDIHDRGPFAGSRKARRQHQTSHRVDRRWVRPR